MIGTRETATLTPGFADPVRDAQRVFRSLLDASARPGTVVALDNEDRAGRFGAMGAIALTLLDFETLVWLDAADADADADAADFADWLRFHCACPAATAPHDAHFAFLDAARMPDLAMFNSGSEKHPEIGATLVVAVPALTGGEPVVLEGPGIKGRSTIAPQGLSGEFWARVVESRAHYQRGLDLMLTAGNALVALPRSTRVMMES